MTGQRPKMADGGTGDEPGTLIPLTSLPNLRDIGGYQTPGGHVRTGLLYRSVALNNLTDQDAAELERRGIRTVFDLRTVAERTAEPDRLPTGAVSVVCDVLADSANAAPAQMLQVINDPARATQEFGGGKAVELFHGAYRQIVSSDSALRAYRTLFTDIAADEADRPVLFHCTTGKDRTGWAAAATCSCSASTNKTCSTTTTSPTATCCPPSAPCSTSSPPTAATPTSSHPSSESSPAT
jgi:protein-tyrosine phosphatase